MTVKHTPTPWLVDAENGYIVADDPRRTIIVAGMGGSFSNPEIAADADLIVRAVNAHDDLVAALKLALPVLLVADDDAVPRLAHRIQTVEAALRAVGVPC